MSVSSRGGRSQRVRGPKASTYMPLASARSQARVLATARSHASRASRAQGAAPISPITTATARLTARSRQSSSNIPSSRGKKSRPNLKVVRDTLQRLIEQRPSKDSDQFRHVFRLFGRPKFGVTPEIFKRQIHTRMGVVLTDEEAKELFSEFDYEGRGAISLPQLIERILPKDYTRPSWNIVRDDEMDEEQKQRESTFKPYQDHVPASLKNEAWTLQGFIDQLTTKIVERTKRPQDQFREAYIVFGKPEKGLTPEEFKEMVFRLGLVVTDANLDIAFKHFDRDGNGVLTFAELCRLVLPKDYTTKQWPELADERETMRIMGTTKKFDTVEREWPTALAAQLPTTNGLRDALALKILERTKRANDQYREAFSLFGAPKGGITLEIFSNRIRMLGMVASDKQIKALFDMLDISKTGNITFQDLVAQIMPKDYVAETWVERAERRMDADEARREASFAPVLESWPVSLQQARMTHEEIVSQIRSKIIERTKRPEDQYREAFKLFGSPHFGITEDELGATLSRLGMVLSKDELHNLFLRFDANGNGILEFHEFVGDVMPPDYTAKPWNIIAEERAHKEMEASKRAALAESPFFGGTVTRPLSRPAVTPVPAEILEAGRRALKEDTKKRRSKSRRKAKKSDRQKKRGDPSLKMPLSTSRISLGSARASARSSATPTRSASTPVLVPKLPKL